MPPSRPTFTPLMVDLGPIKWPLKPTKDFTAFRHKHCKLIFISCLPHVQKNLAQSNTLKMHESNDDRQLWQRFRNCLDGGTKSFSSCRIHHNPKPLSSRWVLFSGPGSRVNRNAWSNWNLDAATTVEPFIQWEHYMIKVSILRIWMSISIDVFEG